MLQILSSWFCCCKDSSNAISGAYVTIAKYLCNYYIWSCFPSLVVHLSIFLVVHLFPPYSRITEKSIKLPAYFLGHPKLKVTLQVSLPIPGSCLHIIRLSSSILRGGPERDRQGEAQRGGCQGIASGVNRKQGGSGICSQDFCCAWRCFPKKGGQLCHPHKSWCSFLQGKDCFPQPLHPHGREMGLIGTRQDELVGSSPGVRPTEKAGSSCRGM